MNEKLIRFNRFNIFSHISSTKIINLSYIIKKNVLAVRCEKFIVTVRNQFNILVILSLLSLKFLWYLQKFDSTTKTPFCHSLWSKYRDPIEIVQMVSCPGSLLQATVRLLRKWSFAAREFVDIKRVVFLYSKYKAVISVFI